MARPRGDPGAEHEERPRGDGHAGRVAAGAHGKDLRGVRSRRGHDAMSRLPQRLRDLREVEPPSPRRHAQSSGVPRPAGTGAVRVGDEPEREHPDQAPRPAMLALLPGRHGGDGGDGRGAHEESPIYRRARRQR